ncbi:MAG: filamentous hemagglutinin N-terminal domain-containing protein, partial [Coleofasciculaceae cyanobacterium]
MGRISFLLVINHSKKTHAPDENPGYTLVRKKDWTREISNKLLFLLPFSILLCPSVVRAQSIVPAPDGTGTVVTPTDNRINITGGQTSTDGANLFHSFTQFGLDSNQTVNFLSSPIIQNIFSRITGGNPSTINGLIQVTGGTSNLFLINPSGIVFGSNARLDVPASFTATTATGIGIGNSWFNAVGANDYASLVGTPNAFTFATAQTPGAIINAGSLAVPAGNNLNLIGGTVVSTGNLSAPEGQVAIATVPGQTTLRISQPGHLLSLEVQPSNLPLTPLSLPQLLTGSEPIPGLAVNSAGQAELTQSGLPVETGDVVAKNINSSSATLAAQNNLTLVESQLQTTGDLNLLAQNTVRVRDSVTDAFVAKAEGNLYIQGNQGIDILSLNHPEVPFQSGGNLSLVSDGIISGDSHFISTGDFSILNTSGSPGNFVSLYDPIITSNGDVSFGGYNGTALKVTADGNITYGNITITGPDTNSVAIGSDPDRTILTTTPALILSAGRNISTGNITTSNQGSGDAGPIRLTANQGNITTGNLTTSDQG